jgi:hypothetical protein
MMSKMGKGQKSEEQTRGGRNKELISSHGVGGREGRMKGKKALSYLCTIAKGQDGFRKELILCMSCIIIITTLPGRQRKELEAFWQRFWMIGRGWQWGCHSY